MSGMQHIVLHYKLGRMKSVGMQPKEPLAPHEEIDFGSMQFDDLKILFFYHQKIFDRGHNHPKNIGVGSIIGSNGLDQSISTSTFQFSSLPSS